MNVAHSFSMIGLVGLLTGCVTRVDTGYVEPYVSVDSTSTYNAPPVYSASPAYYAAPVSGYSTTTIYDGGYPVYMDTHYPHYPHHRHHRTPPPPPPPRFVHRPQNHGGFHGGHIVHSSAHGGNGSHGRRMPSGLCAQPQNKKTAPVNRLHPSNRKPVPNRTPPRGGSAPTRHRK